MDLKKIELRLLHIEKMLLGNKAVLTFNEAAEYTGLSKSYLYKLTSAGMVPHSKPNGKQVYFDKLEIDSWLLKNKVKTADVLDKEAATYVTLKKGKR